MEILTRLKDGVLSEMISNLTGAVPKIIAALFVIIFGWIIARLVRNGIYRLLKSIHIDDLVEKVNDIDVIQSSGVRIRLSTIIASVVYYVLMLIFLVAATDVLGIPAITQLISDVLNYMPSLLSAGVIFIIGIFVADLLRNAVMTTLQSIGIPSAKLIANLVFYLILITVTVTVLAQAKIDTNFISSNITVIIGAASLAFAFGYGLASKDVVANYLAGIYNRDKIRIGDEIRLEGVQGKVVNIDQSSLMLQTHDRAIVIPLSKLTVSMVEIIYPEGQEDQLLQSGHR